MIVEGRTKSESNSSILRWEVPKITNIGVGMVQLKKKQVKLQGGELSECSEAKRNRMKSPNKG